MTYRPSGRAWLLLPLLALVAGGTGCISRSARSVIVDDGYTVVSLRQQKRWGKVVDQGYQHPAYIAPVRIGYVLSRIDLRTGDGERLPAIPLKTLFTIADGISKALGEADSSQTVVVQSIRRDKHWGVFDRKYLTSLLCYLKDDLLYVQVSRSDWEIPPRRQELAERGGQDLPETWPGEFPMDFRLISDRAMTLVDQQSVAVDWRDDIFAKATRTRVTPSGRVVRREVLMESAEDETDYGPEPTRNVDDLSLEQLRELTELEEARQRGQVTEAEYGAAKRRILTGEEPATPTGSGGAVEGPPGAGGSAPPAPTPQ